ncbi:MAG TPA: hypothetical protein VKW78_07555 [Terriglobales bacterium]|nr:hypothetical protein [Terriglobales bacterium]
MRPLRLMFVAVLLTSAAFSQVSSNNPPMDMSRTASSYVDGSQHPELVPDNVAYRLFFVAVAQEPNPAADKEAVQNAQLLKLGFSAKDMESTKRVLEDFKVQYDNLVSRFNDSSQVAMQAGDAADYSAFSSQADALVAYTREKLKQRVSADAMHKLDLLVQSEKSNMKMVRTTRAH